VIVVCTNVKLVLQKLRLYLAFHFSCIEFETACTIKVKKMYLLGGARSVTHVTPTRKMHFFRFRCRLVCQLFFLSSQGLLNNEFDVITGHLTGCDGADPLNSLNIRILGAFSA